MADWVGWQSSGKSKRQQCELKTPLHPSTASPYPWCGDEWYLTFNLIRAAEYGFWQIWMGQAAKAGTMRSSHRLVSTHDGGRAWYTGGSHTRELFGTRPFDNIFWAEFNMRLMPPLIPNRLIMTATVNLMFPSFARRGTW